MIISYESAIEAILAYKYAVYFPIAVVEGPIVNIIAGFLAHDGYLNILIILFLAVLADVVGDVGLYWLGRHGRKKILHQEKWFFGITKEGIERIEKHFDRHTTKTIVIGKYTHTFAFIVSVAAGVARIDFKKFMTVNVISNFPKSLLFLLIGFYFGKAYKVIDAYFNAGSSAIFVLGALFVAGFFATQRFGQKYFSK